MQRQARPADNPLRSPAMPSLPPDLAAWTRWFSTAPIPVLSATAATVDAMAAREDAADAHTIATLVGGDPLMALRLLVHVAGIRHTGRMGTDAETVTAALVYLGIPPFFHAFTGLPTVDTLLAGQPEARAGLQQVLQRARRAARHALEFAVHRADPDADLLQQAALLHDFPEMLLWCHAPGLALQLQRQRQARCGTPPGEVEQDVLNVTLAALRQSLLAAWHLPEALCRLLDEASITHPQAANVQLAVRLAGQDDWDAPQAVADIAALAALLNVSEAAAFNLLSELQDP